MSASSKKTTHNMTLRKRKPQNRHSRSNSEPTEGQLRHYQERARELGISDSQQELASYEPPKKNQIVLHTDLQMQ